MNILLLDDEPLALKMLGKAVSEAVPDANLFSFSKPREAIDFAKTTTLQVAFLDINMQMMGQMNPQIRNNSEGIEQIKISEFRGNQIQNILKNFNKNSFSKLNEHLNNLIMHPEANSNKFEESMKFIGSSLGAISSRPEREFTHTTLDVLWQISNDSYLLFSCKNRATSEIISKEYIDAMHGDMAWLKQNISDTADGKSIIIIPNGIVCKEATINENFRILSDSKLSKFISWFLIMYSNFALAHSPSIYVR